MTPAGRWRSVPLASVVADAQYGTPVRANDQGLGLPVLRMSNLTYTGAFDLTDIKHVELPAADLGRYSVCHGDLLFNRTNSPELVGKMGVWRRAEPFAFAGYLVRLRLRREVADPEFVAAWFNTPEMKELLRARAKPSINMANISAREVLELPLVLPSLEEQRRIADVLDRADALRAKRRAALGLLDSLTQAIFLDMFGDPTVNHRRWPTATIGDIGKVITGNTPSRGEARFFGSAIEWMKSDNVNTGEYYVTRAAEGLSEEGRAAGRTAPPESILVTCIAGSPGSIGNAAMADREVAFDQQLNAFIPSEGNCHFHYGQIRAGKRLIQAASTGGMKGIVSKSRFEAIRLIQPPHRLQEEFATRVLAAEAVRANMRASLTEMDALFASLQHRAFRGEL
jgi:type I restriction enzyme, S subunit